MTTTRRRTGETNPNLVHRLATELAQSRIYTPADVERYATAWWVREAFTQRCDEAGDRHDEQALDELRTFRKECGSYVCFYDFMSQVVDYGTSDLEKLAEFLRQLIRAPDRWLCSGSPGPPSRRPVWG